MQRRHVKYSSTATMNSGADSWLERVAAMDGKASIREQIDTLREERTCSDCNGTRLNVYARSVDVLGLTIGDLHTMSVERALTLFFRNAVGWS